ncbi:MAG: trypsin-like peptidase domain-containing protein, partial [Acidobacteria bacterium]|nr:trypsin-like peptidase domain-containing protein [Acidobacteriota bacterium]
AGAAHARHELRKIVGTEMQSRARKFMYAFAAVSVLLVVTVSYIVYRSFFAIGKEAVRLQVQLSEIKSKQLNAAEIERLRVSLAAAAAHQVEPSEHVIAQYQGSVCLIQGSYIFRDKDSGNVLRLAAPGPESPPRLVSSGTADVTVEGNGPPLENSYSGTGFLVSADGKILTNRHVGEPWWGDAQAEKIIAAGFRPERGSVVAYFPDRPRAFALKTLKVSGSGDVALLQATPPEDLPEPIPLEGKTPAVGAPIMLIGYPLGLEPILARANQKELDQIPNFLNLSVEQVARELATRNLIRPFITLGHVSNVTEKVLAYDAASTMGSSGGPLFNQEGKVIAIHYAVLPEFTAASLGVPIQHALALMKN